MIIKSCTKIVNILYVNVQIYPIYSCFEFLACIGILLVFITNNIIIGLLIRDILQHIG